MHPCVFLLVSLACGLASSLPHPIVKDEDIDITEINKGLDLFEGDIKVAAKTRRRRSIRSEQHRWPLPVPYYLNWSLDINAKGVILRALEQFRLKTCIDFRPRRWGEQHISIKKDTGCWSHVGKEKWKQDLSIGPNCDTVATVEHELMHALGFWHEQSRYDRDNYITINWENIEAGREHNFKIRTNDTNSTMDTPYDYFSVMHYPKNAFTNGNGSTIITKLPEFQDVIGQRLDMSHYDIEELNKFYGCNEYISFLDHCSFDDGSLCEMSVCSRRSRGWRRVSRAKGGPHSDHTYLGTGSQGTGFFMHFSTKRGTVGDSAKLQTRRMTPRRSCKIQCLEFFYYHSGSWSDQLNIWIREFDGVDDIIETRRLMSQIKGSPADYWKLHHVPLNATKTFQVEFEARKGAGASRGGFSVDDINLSETECPHHTWQIRNFEEKLKASNTTPFLVSPYYSYDGYRYLIFVELKKDKLEVFVSLVSGINDDALQWPCRWRQVTFTLLDQNPHIQRRMSKQRSVTSTPLWLNSASELRSRDFLKGGDAFLHISMQDISPLRIRSNLPCPSMKGKTFSVSPLQQTDDDGPCGTRPSSTPTLMSTTYTPNTITSTTSTPTTTTSTTSTPITTTSTTYTPTTATSTPTTTTSTTYTPTTATSTPTTTTSTTYTPTTTTSSTYTPTTTTSSTYTPTTTTSSTYTSTTTTSTTYTPITTTSRTTASTTYTPITTTSRTTASTLRPYRVTMQTTTSTSTSGKSTPIDSLNASLSTIRAGNVSTTDSPPVTPPDRCDNIFSVTCYKIEISPGALVLVTLLVFIWGMLCKPCCCKKKRSVPSAENMVFMQMQEN